MDQNSEKEHYSLAPVETSKHSGDKTPSTSNLKENSLHELENRSRAPPSSENQSLVLHIQGEIAGYTEDENTMAGDENGGNHDQSKSSARPERTIKPTLKIIENRIRTDKDNLEKMWVKTAAAISKLLTANSRFSGSFPHL